MFRISSYVPVMLASGLSLILTGTAARAAAITYTDLYTLGRPTGFSSVVPTGYQQAAGGQVVGYGSGTGTAGNNHALLWSAAAPSGVDLNPTNLGAFTASTAYGTDGTRQVGSGFGTATGSANHALLWSGTAASAVDLHPTLLPGLSSSFALGSGGTQQVGYGYGTATGSNPHALLWTGSAASAVDMNPSSATCRPRTPPAARGRSGTPTARRPATTTTPPSGLAPPPPRPTSTPAPG
jgi:hypothetical protein